MATGDSMANDPSSWGYDLNDALAGAAYAVRTAQKYLWQGDEQTAREYVEHAKRHLDAVPPEPEANTGVSRKGVRIIRHMLPEVCTHLPDEPIPILVAQPLGKDGDYLYGRFAPVLWHPHRHWVDDGRQFSADALQLRLKGWPYLSATDAAERAGPVR